MSAEKSRPSPGQLWSLAPLAGPREGSSPFPSRDAEHWLLQNSFRHCHWTRCPCPRPHQCTGWTGCQVQELLWQGRVSLVERHEASRRFALLLKEAAPNQLGEHKDVDALAGCRILTHSNLIKNMYFFLPYGRPVRRRKSFCRV